MKLTYWVATHNQTSNPSNDLRAKTKKAVKQLVAESPNPEDFNKPHKVEVDYKDGFDLLTRALTGGIDENPSETTADADTETESDTATA